MQTKSEMINRIAELAEENAKLNAIIDSYQPRLQALKDENEQLKELFEIESLTDIKTGETMYRSRQIMHFVDILQEIKEICKNSYTSVSEDYYRMADKILDLINKSEVE